MTGLKRDRHLVGEHPAASHVHHGGEVHKVPGHRDVGGVQRPDLVGSGDGQLA